MNAVKLAGIIAMAGILCQTGKYEACDMRDVRETRDWQGLQLLASRLSRISRVSRFLARPSMRWPAATAAMPEGGAAAHARQADRHGGTFAGGAADGNRSAVFFHDFLDCGQSQADSRPFGCEKRLKDFVDKIGRDRDAVVLDEDLDFQAFPGPMLADLNMEMAARSHGFAGIFENAQEGLLQLRFIGTHRHEDRRVIFGHLDTRRFKIRCEDDQGALQGFGNPAEVPVQLQWFGEVQNLVQDRFDSNKVAHGVFHACLWIEVQDTFAGHFFELCANRGQGLPNFCG
jgi:hypothetical protein